MGLGTPFSSIQAGGDLWLWERILSSEGRAAAFRRFPCVSGALPVIPKAGVVTYEIQPPTSRGFIAGFVGAQYHGMGWFSPMQLPVRMTMRAIRRAILAQVSGKAKRRLMSTSRPFLNVR